MKTMSNEKYEISRKMVKMVVYEGRDVELHRIVALRDFGNVKKGDFGGLVESEDNLSQEGDCWIYGEAEVAGNAKVTGDAIVADTAKVYGNALITDLAKVYEHAVVRDNAEIHDCSLVHGHTVVCDNAKLSDHANVYGSSCIQDHSEVHLSATVINATIKDHAVVTGDAFIRGGIPIDSIVTLTISGNTNVIDHARVLAFANISGKSKISLNATVDGNADIKESTITGYSYVGGYSNIQDSLVGGYATVDGYAIVKDKSTIVGYTYVSDHAEIENSQVFNNASIDDCGSARNCQLCGDSLVTGNASIYNAIITDSAVVKDNVVVDGNYYICGNCTLTGNEIYEQGTPSKINQREVTRREIDKIFKKIKDPSEFIEKKKPTVFVYETKTHDDTNGCSGSWKIIDEGYKETISNIITTFNMLKYGNVDVHFETADGYTVDISSSKMTLSLICSIRVKNGDDEFSLKVSRELTPQFSITLHSFDGTNKGHSICYDMEVLKKIMVFTDFSKHLKGDKNNG